MEEPKHFTTMISPVGLLLIAGRGGALTDLRFVRAWPGPPAGAARPDQPAGAVQTAPAPLGAGITWPGPGWRRDDAMFAELKRELAAYFRGELRRFSAALAPEGTPFQLAAWRVLGGIPYGTTITYGEQARRMGNPAAARAAGAANGANPIAIIVPCHRVVGAGGRLGGFGGGVEVKRRLLELEGVAGLRV